jgi:hypothetical protein
MINKLIEIKRKEHAEVGFIHFDDKEITELNQESIIQIEEAFKGFGILRLPPNEILFFEWLKENDSEVWNDLWDDGDEPYHISVDFLHHFSKDENGFPICDLENTDNYWFSVRHIKPKGKQNFETINLKLRSGQQLTLEELLLYEIVQNSIDIWHFCYRYKINLDKAKNLVAEMHKNDILVHLTNRDDLIKYIDF